MISIDFQPFSPCLSPSPCVAYFEAPSGPRESEKCPGALSRGTGEVSLGSQQGASPKEAAHHPGAALASQVGVLLTPLLPWRSREGRAVAS